MSPQSRYQELCKSLAEARASFSAYRSECFFFAATFARGFTEYAAWPRENAGYEPVAGDAGADRRGSRTRCTSTRTASGTSASGSRSRSRRGRARILLRVRFKKLETRYIISLYGVEDFEVAAPTPEALQPIYDSILNAVKRHFAYGLRLFLENGGRGLKIPISAEQLTAPRAADDATARRARPARAYGGSRGADRGRVPGPRRADPEGGAGRARGDARALSVPVAPVRLAASAVRGLDRERARGVRDEARRRVADGEVGGDPDDDAARVVAEPDEGRVLLAELPGRSPVGTRTFTAWNVPALVSTCSRPTHLGHDRVHLAPGEHAELVARPGSSGSERSR